MSNFNLPVNRYESGDNKHLYRLFAEHDLKQKVNGFSQEAKNQYTLKTILSFKDNLQKVADA